MILHLSYYWKSIIPPPFNLMKFHCFNISGIYHPLWVVLLRYGNRVRWLHWWRLWYRNGLWWFWWPDFCQVKLKKLLYNWTTDTHCSFSIRTGKWKKYFCWSLKLSCCQNTVFVTNVMIINHFAFLKFQSSIIIPIPIKIITYNIYS